MIIFKPIQTTFTVHKHSFLYTPKLPNSKNYFLCFSQSNSSDSSSSIPPKGDPQKQDILARIAQLQAQKLRLTDFLDEKSADLTQFAEEADAEFEKIGEDALKDLDEASARVDTRFLSRLSMKFAVLNVTHFLFLFILLMNRLWETLRARCRPLRSLTNQSAGSKSRRYIYLAFIGLLVVAIAESFLTSPDWRKVAVLGAMLIALVSQFSYEQKMSSMS